MIRYIDVEVVVTWVRDHPRVSLKRGLRVVAIGRNGFVEDAAAAVVQPIRAHLLVGAVHKVHGAVNIALHRSQLALVYII